MRLEWGGGGGGGDDSGRSGFIELYGEGEGSGCCKYIQLKGGNEQEAFVAIFG